MDQDPSTGVQDASPTAEDQDISSVDQDPSTGVQDTSPTVHQYTPGYQDTRSRDQDTPRNQDTSLTDPSTLPATTPTTTTVTQVTLSNVDTSLVQA